MAKAAARVNDNHQCDKHSSGTIKKGSPNVTIGGQPAARVGDEIQCTDGSKGSIKSSQACLIINGQPAARVDDPIDHNGKITSGMNTVTIADGDPFIEIGNDGTVIIGSNVTFGS